MGCLASPTAVDAVPMGCFATPTAVETAPCASVPTVAAVFLIVMDPPEIAVYLLGCAHSTMTNAQRSATVLDSEMRGS